MAGFVQIVEFQTSRIGEVKTLGEEMTPGSDSAVLRRTVTADQDRPGHYYSIVEFDSYDAAMTNSARPETSEFATRMAALCDVPPTFRNLNVLDTWEASSGPSKTVLAAGAAAVGVAAAAAMKSKSSNDSPEQQDVAIEYTEVTPVPVVETAHTTGAVGAGSATSDTPDPLSYPNHPDRPL